MPSRVGFDGHICWPRAEVLFSKNCTPGAVLTQWIHILQSKNEKLFLERLDLPTGSPIWYNSLEFKKKRKLIPPITSHQFTHVKKITKESLFYESIIKALANEAINQEDYLCELDMKCGDGFPFIHLLRGFRK